MAYQFPIRYTDVSGLNLYALVFKEDGTCYSSGNGFVTFNPSFSASLHPIYLTESRLGSYQSTPDSSGFSIDQEFTIEVYQYTLPSGRWGNDFIKSVGTIIWNKQNDIGSFKTPYIDAPDTLGGFHQGETFNYRTRIFGAYGKPSNNISRLNYHILNQSNSVLATGFITSTGLTDDYYYNANLNLTAGTFGSGSYVMRVSGIYAEGSRPDVVLGAETQFNVTVTAVTPSNSDSVVAALGYASGTVNDGTPTASSFITNLASASDSFYCGQIIRFVEGNNLGQGRIISAYNGTTKRLTTNKSLSSSPSNGQRFIIYPLGGELGVS